LLDLVVELGDLCSRSDGGIDLLHAALEFGNVGVLHLPVLPFKGLGPSDGTFEE